MFQENSGSKSDNIEYLYATDRVNAVIDMRYTNYLVAKGLVEVVEDWFQNLPLVVRPKRPSKWERVLSEHSPFERFAVVPIAVFTSCLIFAALTLYGVSSTSGLISHRLNETLATTFVIFALAFSFYLILFTTIIRRFSNIQYPSSRHLMLNAGDARSMDIFKERLKVQVAAREFFYKSIVVAFFVSLLASVLVAGFG